MTCPQCNRPTPTDAKFCPECGGRLSLACPACGVDNAPGSKFCKECGQPLGRAAPTPPAPQSYTPSHLAERILHARGSLEGERKQVTVRR
jgi:predicted amidophosphoribosyltransferase